MFAPTFIFVFCGRTDASLLARALKIGRKSSSTSSRFAYRGSRACPTPHRPMYTTSVLLHSPLFQQVLVDISWGWPSNLVRRFIIEAYVKGARTCGSAENAEFEGLPVCICEEAVLSSLSSPHHS